MKKKFAHYKIHIGAIICLIMFLSACSFSGYRFNGASIDYNKTKTIQIADFPIRSSYVWGPMGPMFNNALKDKFANYTHLQQVKRNGDLAIQGQITNYTQRNKSVSSEGYSAQTELTITVNVKFTNRTNHKQDFVEQLIKHPEKMNRETLYDLRSLIALYPYYQTARILLLQNLYILHDASFDEELRRSALYITDRRVIFNMVEAAHYQLRTKSTTNNDAKNNISAKNKEDRTTSLIDSFLDQIPKEAKDDKKTEKRKPTPADAAVDYVAYLLEAEEFEEQPVEQDDDNTTQNKESQQEDRTASLIDSFIEDGGFNLRNDDNEGKPLEFEYTPEIAITALNDNEDKEPAESYFTETLAKIYIKQGRYEKALEIIKRLNLNNSKKNAYFADQIRFLEKLIIITK